MVVQGAGVGPIVKRLGERRALLLGLACGALGFFIYGAAPTGPLFWVGIPVMALWGIAGAAIQALTTQLVAPDQQGQLQGATNSVNSVAQMVGPFLFTLTFAYFISDQAPVKMPGAPFLLAAALLGLALCDRVADAGDKSSVQTELSVRKASVARTQIRTVRTRWARLQVGAFAPSRMTATCSYFFTSGQSLASSGLAASSGAIVAICL